MTASEVPHPPIVHATSGSLNEKNFSRRRKS
jgi:hypothetical protein